jgi:hypothetical protein
MIDTVSSIKENKFLVKAQGPNSLGLNRQYMGTDDLVALRKNLKIQPSDWRYRTRPVNYTLNSQYYRTKPFEEINWSESVVIFGCSMVFGIGLDDSETIDAAFYRQTGIPAVNMGSPGTSMMFSLYNSAILHKNYPTPKAVIQLWTGLDRCTYFASGDIVNHGSWNIEDSYNRAWTRDASHAVTNALMCQMISSQLWKDKTKYYEASSFGATAEALECDMLSHVDQGRDLAHPGHRSAEITAEIIADKLKL